MTHHACTEVRYVLDGAVIESAMGAPFSLVRPTVVSDAYLLCDGGRRQIDHAGLPLVAERRDTLEVR
jgi:hypothetical protein